MCDLFGMSCNAEDRAWKSLAIFAHEHSENNPHGWGIGYYNNGKAIVKRAPEQAKTSQTFFSEIEKAKSNIIIAHVRARSVGMCCEENCHPFNGKLFNRDWIFAHNGTFKKFPQHPRSVGGTDSEQIFHTLLDQVKSYQRNGVTHGTFSGIQQGIKTIFEKHGKNNSTLNFLMSDGTHLYAFHHNDDNDMYYLEREKDYGSALLISTQKLGPGSWKKIRVDSLFMASNGKIDELSDPIF